MKVLLIGSGGREHALCWAISASPLCTKLFCAPGNAGIAQVAECHDVGAEDIAGQVALAQKLKIDFVVIAPDAPLVAGMADAMAAAGIKHFGPSRAAARLEGSKGFTKDLCKRYGIPTAAYERFDDLARAEAYLKTQKAPIVIKADGLAAGKGVIIAETIDQAIAAVRDMLSGNKFGAAGSSVVIEEFMQGEEASFIVLCDGKNVLPLATSQDHKRLKDGDIGPNTGGMGAYSPAPVVTPSIHARAMREVILPTLAGMEKDGIPYTGFLYAGLMITKDGKVNTLEFNCRMGDPETQPIMMRLKSDLVDLIEHAIDGTLDQVEAEWDLRVALGVVLAAHGYPDNPRKGDVISGLPESREAGEDYHVFHAGTTLQGNDVVISGGRVLCVTALGHNVRTAQKRAYEIAAQIRFDGMQLRRDIGYRAIGPAGARKP